MEDRISRVIRHYMDCGEIAGAVLMVRRDGELVYDQAFGYADIHKAVKTHRKTVFRLCSMTKPITAAAIMQLEETGRIDLNDPLSKFIPQFCHMKVCSRRVGQEAYEPDPDSPAGVKAGKEVLEQMEYVDAAREITIFDLLNHSSGLGMGPAGCAMAEQFPRTKESVQDRAARYAQIPLDFQPGTGTGYSACAAFEVLAAVVETVSGESFYGYLRDHIFTPLDMQDTSFALTKNQEERLCRLYEYTHGELTDVTDDCEDWAGMDPGRTGVDSGAAGLFGTVEDYEKFAHMLLNKGQLAGNRILQADTVERMAGKGVDCPHWLDPGTRWGLGMAVFADPDRIHRKLSPGTFGWSGAFGTHFYVDPSRNMEVVLGINRSNIGGSGSHVSFAVEEGVHEMFCCLT